MAHARPEYAITLALIGVLLAIGVPAVRRGQIVVGTLFVSGALAIGVWFLTALRRR